MLDVLVIVILLQQNNVIILCLFDKVKLCQIYRKSYIYIKQEQKQQICS